MSNSSGKKSTSSTSARYFKVVIRKLPCRDYKQENFLTDFERVLDKLEIDRQAAEFLHFFEGCLRFYIRSEYFAALSFLFIVMLAEAEDL